jgi:uncharacterized protein YjdB
MRLLRSAHLLLALALAACGGGSTTVTPPPPPPPPSVDHLVIDNGSFTMNVGETRQLQVRALTATGDVVSGAAITYASTTSATAAVNSSGVVGGVSPGTTTITATSGTKSASITVTVQLVPIVSFTAVIGRATIKTNDTTRIITTLRDANNNLVTDRLISWRSADTTTVLAGPSGIVFGLRPGGPVAITGTIEGKTATVNVLVTPALVASVRIIPDSTTIPPGDSLQLGVEVKDEFGGIVENPEVIWASVDAQLASVSPTGLLRGVQFGTTTVQATVNGITGRMPTRVAIRETAKFRLSIDNRLRYPVNITQNDVLVGQAGASTVTELDRPVTERAVFGWALVRPNGFGETVLDVLPRIDNPTGTIHITVTNVVSDGRVYFTPQIRNLTADKLWLRFPLLDLGTPCLCATSPIELVSREYGYWLLTPQSTMEVYRIDDVNFVGPKVVIPVPIGQVDPLTGVWRFNLIISP